MKNKQLIEEKLNSLGLELGCYNEQLEKLTKKELTKVLDNLEYGSTDIQVTISKKKYTIEVSEVDNEIDLNVLSNAEYAGQYGDNK